MKIGLTKWLMSTTFAALSFLNTFGQTCSNNYTLSKYKQNFGNNTYLTDQNKGTISTTAYDIGTSSYTQNTKDELQENRYWITNDASIINPIFLSGADNSTNNQLLANNQKGSFVVFLSGKNENTFLETPVSNICQNRDYRLTLWAANPITTDNNEASFVVKITENTSDKIIQEYKSTLLTRTNAPLTWKKFTIDFKALATTSSIKISIIHEAQASNSYIAFDDISLEECTPNPFDIQANKRDFCEGEQMELTVDNQGINNPAVQWQQMIGNQWEDIPGAQTLSYQNKILANSPTQYRVLLANNTASLKSDCGLISNTLTIKAHPNKIELGEDQTVCDSYTLKATGILGEIEWYKDDVKIADTKGNELTVTQSGNYKAISTNDIGCKAEDAVKITILPKPAVEVALTNDFCAGDAAIISPKNTDTKQTLRYTWLQNGTQLHEGNIFTTKKPGEYTLKATNQFGCSTEYTIKAVEHTAPQISTETTSFDVCANSKQALTVKTDKAVRYEWYKNNVKIEGQTANTLQADGAGTYKVIGYSDVGCKSNELQFTVKPLPLPTNEIRVKNQALGDDNTYHICPGESVDTEAVSNARIVKWYDENNQIISENAKVSVSKSGKYKAIATSNIGCTFEQSIQVKVHELPDVQIDGDVEICAGNKNTITASAKNITNDLLSFRWYKKIGADFKVLDETTPTLTISDGSTYKVVIQSKYGCTSEKEFTTKINPRPTAGFIQDSKIVYDNSDVEFKETVQFAGNKEDLTYIWEFGDGSTSNEVNPTHHYPPNAPGESRTYPVKLTVVSKKGCSHTVTTGLLVHNSERPVGRARAELPRCGGRDVRFFDASIPAQQGGKIVGWLWDFGDGSTSTEQNPVHTYTRDGVYTITLRTVDEINGISPITQLSRIQIFLNPTPIANFSVAPNTCLNQPLVVSDRSRINFGAIVKWIWDFGDGSIVVKTSGAPVSHYYSTPGPKTVKLRIETPQICFSEITKSFTIDPLPELGFTIPDVVCMNETFAIKDIKNDNTVKWIWEMSDGSPTIEKTDNNDFTYKFTKAGRRNIILKAINRLGCSEILQKNILVKVMPIANFKVSGEVACLGQAIRIDQISKEDVVSWSWESSEGKLDFDNRPFNYTFKTIGNHFIRLTVVNSLGCPDTFEIPITITAIPKARFSVEDKFWMVDEPVIMKDESTVEDNKWDLISYTWDMGDGKRVFGKQSPEYPYSKSGNYTVKLTTNNRQGCSTSYEQKFTVYDYPKAAFSPEKTDVCADGLLLVTDQSTIGNNTATKLEWDFDYHEGDLPEITVDNPALGQVYQKRLNYTLDVPKTITIRLVIYAKTGHKSIIEKQITIQPLPRLAFDPIPNLCFASGNYQVIEAKELLGLKGKGIFSGKGISENGEINPVIMGLGKHEITYTFVSNYDCVTKIKQMVTVLPSPIVVVPEFIEVFENETFRVSPKYTGNIVGYEWLPADVTSNSIDPNPAIKLQEDTELYVTATNDLGCQTTKKVTVKVYKEIDVPSAFSPNGDGVNDVWHIPNLEHYATKSKLQIFNRQGQVLHEQSGYDIPWDGTSHGQPLPVGTYFYKITKLYGTKDITGTVSIIK